MSFHMLKAPGIELPRGMRNFQIDKECSDYDGWQEVRVHSTVGIALQVGTLSSGEIHAGCPGDAAGRACEDARGRKLETVHMKTVYE